VLFAGDSAHQVSPFGARGANSGLEDAENLAWKLARVLKGLSPDVLLESYHIERSFAADENIRESTRSTDFMAPATKQEARLRRAVLSLAKETEFGKRMVNGGRLSTPSRYETPLSTPDVDTWNGGPPPGASIFDAPLKTGDGAGTFLTDAFTALGKEFTLMQFANGGATSVPETMKAIRIGEGGFSDDAGTAQARYDARPGTAYLLRPDGYVAARFRTPTREAIEAAMNRASAIS
jgi:3-(3-hydroxy-phenyl)propionate hydroxylase